MVKKAYKIITEKSDLCIEDLDGMSLKDVIKFFSRLLEDYGEDASLGYECGWDSPPDWYVRYERPETDKERNTRLAAARRKRDRNKADRERREAEERALYEELRNKYECEYVD